MTYPTKNISFSVFQKQMLELEQFPSGRDINIFYFPDIPDLTPRNVRISLQGLGGRGKSNSMYHKNFVFKIHLHGTSIGVVAGQSYEFTPGTAMLIFPFQLHHIHDVYENDENIRLQKRMLINFELPAGQQQLLMPLKNRILRLEDEDYPLLMEIAGHLADDSSVEKLSCIYKFNILLTRFLNRVSCSAVEPPFKRSKLLENIFKFISAHYTENPTVAEIAEQMGVSESTLRQRLHAECGMPPGMIIRELRLNLAAELLCFSKLSVAEISQRCSFATAFSFSRAFVKRYGVPPLQFRKQNRTDY